MINRDRLPQEPYTESEAATALGITVARPHQLLDQHIFTQGSIRPESIEFTSYDLLLLSFWNKNGKLLPSARRVLQMPKREYQCYCFGEAILSP